MDCEIDEERELLRYLLQYNRLDRAARGIAQQVVAKGESSLKPNQRPVFERYVKAVYFHPKCRYDGRDVPLGEYARWEIEGTCYDCSARMAKDD